MNGHLVTFLYTANVYSSITNKLMHFFAASTSKYLKFDLVENCYIYKKILDMAIENDMQ